MKTGWQPRKVYTGREPYIFVSYARKDSRIVYPVIRRLQEEGYRVWYDKGMQKGIKWADAIRERLQHCCVFLLFMSRAAHQSREVRRECTAAEFEEKHILPVFIDIRPDDLSVDFTVLKTLNGFLCAEIREDFSRLTGDLRKETRMSDYYRDAELLGVGSLPTLSDARTGRGPLNEAERQERLKLIVRKWKDRKADHYEIANVFQLTSKETSAIANLEEIRFPAPVDSRPVNLLHRPLTILKAYVAPLRLLSGLVSRFDENWPPIVEAYSRLAGRSAGALRDLHYFVEFCWLSWGPSVETSFLLKDGKSAFMVAQAATGDEANSIPLIMKPETWRRLFPGENGNRTSGRLLRLDGLLVVNVKEDRHFASLRKHPLFQDFFDENPIALFLPSEPAVRPSKRKTSEDSPCYSTAYVWLMLEELRPGPKIPYPRLTPGAVLPFFEHANLAGRDALTFLQRCLARKAIHHVINCARGKKGDYDTAAGFPKLRYRYATALFDVAMVGILKEEIARLAPGDRALVEERLEIPEPADRRSAQDVCRFVDRLLKKVRNSLPARA